MRPRTVSPVVPTSLVVAVLLCCSGMALADDTNAAASPAAEATQAAEPAAPWSFRNHVQSVLTKTGCNSGACHGAAAGKNGFKLSLRGYDPLADWKAITRHAGGRRIVTGDPGRSLLLTKPTGAVPHKGGTRFTIDSPEYRVLSEWIAAGAPAPASNDPRIERIEILPKHQQLAPGDDSRFYRVLAHFSDGQVEDVTRWARYTATNSSVATVDQQGRLTVTGSGEGAVVAWYLAQNVVATISVPYPNDIPAEVYRKAPRANLIDGHVLAKLESLRLPFSPPCDDATFIRRAFLDTIGLLPTADEVRGFLKDDKPDKRARLIDSLLERPEFVDYWTYRWSDLLLVTGARLRPKAVDAYYTWIRKQVEQNTPWDEFARGIVTARGNTVEHGAANFFSLHQDPLDMAETTSMAFLGMSINCARCHDHPLEKWTNDQYYGFASLFARVRGKGWGGDFRSGDGERTVFVANAGEVMQPRTGRPQPPTPLDAEPLAFESDRDRRDYLATWLTSPDNPYFTRAIVNRVWAAYLGRGIVESVDDLRLTNPESNPPLMAALGEYLVQQKYDLKQLMRLIMNSATYQRSSEPLPGNKTDRRFYSRYMPRRMSAEVLLDAMSRVTGVPTEFTHTRQDGGSMQKVEIAKGTRAVQLRDTSVVSKFLETFGRPERLITCECERSDEPSMTQVLHLVNGGTLNEKLSAAGSRIDDWLDAGTTNAALVEELYLAALARMPADDERAQLLAVLNETDARIAKLAPGVEQAFREAFGRAPTAAELKRTLAAAGRSEKRLAIEDLCWSVLTSREFLFQH